eukprot:2328395-Amphidinium_carterae.1
MPTALVRLSPIGHYDKTQKNGQDGNKFETWLHPSVSRVLPMRSHPLRDLILIGVLEVQHAMDLPPGATACCQGYHRGRAQTVPSCMDRLAHFCAPARRPYPQ